MISKKQRIDFSVKLLGNKLARKDDFVEVHQWINAVAGRNAI